LVGKITQVTIAAAAGPAIDGSPLQLHANTKFVLWLSAGMSVVSVLPALDFEVAGRSKR
jgi:hypothetical protein